MAKRKRLSLTPAPAPSAASDTLETKGYVNGWMGYGARRAPIADVAGDAAAQAALEAVSDELRSARADGRLIQRLSLDQIRAEHLRRDRIALDEEDMAALVASLEARGQQTPIEVLELPEGGYGLISGLRRIEALRRMGREEVLALVRVPEGAAEAYVAMVEENEIRANLSFYERARIAAEAAQEGVFATAEAAVQALFASSSASKRSKILNFVTLHTVLGSHLQYPTAIPEKLGLALVKAIDTVPTFGVRLRDSLRKTPAADVAAERAALERALSRAGGKPASAPSSSGKAEVVPGLFAETRAGKLVLSGPGVDDGFRDDLLAWLKARQA